jgi:hypothetical protein
MHTSRRMATIFRSFPRALVTDLSQTLGITESLRLIRLHIAPSSTWPDTRWLVCTLTSELKSCLDVVTQDKAEWRSEPAPSLEWKRREGEKASFPEQDQLHESLRIAENTVRFAQA